jgi:hypothetical protein
MGDKSQKAKDKTKKQKADVKTQKVDAAANKKLNGQASAATGQKAR